MRIGDAKWDTFYPKWVHVMCKRESTGQRSSHASWLSTLTDES